MNRLPRLAAGASLWVVLTGCAYSSSGPRPVVVNVSPSGNTVQIDVRGAAQEFSLSHAVDGYEVNCEGSLLVAWGKPVPLNLANPQDSSLTVIDLRRLGIRSTAHFDKGIYAIEYAAAQPVVIVWSALGILLDLESGKTRAPSTEAELNLPPETCDRFPHKSFRKYAE